jgi:hypothetical protein
MICHSHGGGAMVVLCRPVLKRPMCLSSNTDQLRTQLDQLHAEAESTRAKGFIRSFLSILNFIQDLKD